MSAIISDSDLYRRFQCDLMRAFLAAGLITDAQIKGANTAGDEAALILGKFNEMVVALKTTEQAFKLIHGGESIARVLQNKPAAYLVALALRPSRL